MTIASRFRLAAMTGVAAIALASVASAQAEGEMLQLDVALAVIDANFNTTTASVLRLADELGFFERNGLDVNYVTLDGTPQAVAALISGDVDLADISIDAAIRLRAENDMAVRGIVATGIGPAFLIAGKEEITSVADLAGRSFAIADYGSLDHQLTQAVLRALEMEPDAPEFVAIGAPDVRVQALAAGQVDATTVSFGTFSSISDTPGIHVILPADEFSDLAPGMTKFIVGTEETIAENREAIQRFTNAIVETSRAMEADPEGWVDLAAAARPELTRENLEMTAGLNAARWCINGCMNPEKLAESIEFIYSNPEFAEVPVLGIDDLADLGFTISAMETLGVAGGTGLDARE